MAKIAIDATPVSRTGKGLSRFLVGVLGAVARHMLENEYIIFINRNRDLPELPSAPNVTYVDVRPRNAILWDVVECSAELRRHNVDVLLSCSDRLPLLHGKPMLLYLFELPRHRHALERVHAARYARFSMRLTDILFPFTVRRAKRILVSSKATMDDLCSTFRMAPDGIDVVYPGREDAFGPEVDVSRQNEIRRRFNAPDGYVLHFSSASDPRDNTEVALRAFHQSRLSHPHALKLVVAGNADPDKQELTPTISELGINDDVVWAGYIPEAELANVYRYAALYLDTSLYEGFGYQVVEAMACGTPVVCSNVTSLPEVVGDAAITADPNDVDGFAAAIALVLSSRDIAQTMTERGLKQIERFSWVSFCESLQHSIDLALCV